MTIKQQSRECSIRQLDTQRDVDRARRYRQADKGGFGRRDLPPGEQAAQLRLVLGSELTSK